MHVVHVLARPLFMTAHLSTVPPLPLLTQILSQESSLSVPQMSSSLSLVPLAFCSRSSLSLFSLALRSPFYLTLLAVLDVHVPPDGLLEQDEP